MFWTRDTKFLASNTGIGYSPISEMGTFLIGNAWKLESLGWNEFRTGSARVSAEISPRARCEICRAPAPNFGTRGEFPVAIARWQNYPHIWKLLLVIESFFFLFFLPRKQINLKVCARNLSDRWTILEIMGEKRKKFNRKIGRTKSQIWFPPAGAKFGWKRILTISSLNFLDEFSPPAWSIVHPWSRSGGKIGWRKRDDRAISVCRTVRDGRRVDSRHDVRPRVCQFAIKTAIRPLLLATVPVLLPKEHPVLVPLPGKVTTAPTHYRPCCKLIPT